MIRKLTMGMMISLLLLGLAPTLSAATRVIVRPQVGYYFGPSYRWYPHPWYGGGPSVYVAPITGELKIKTDDKDARVFLDGGYLGLVRKTKKFDLRPGNHEIELRDARGNVLYKEKVAIVPGHTTEFKAEGSAD
jgi:hypothetical protein